MLPITSAVPNRTLRLLLLAAALVFAQQAAQLHALSHAQHDMAKAERSGKCIPPVSHPAEQCIAYHAVDSALPVLVLAIEPPRIALPAVAPAALPLPFSPRIVFDSRAPPAVS
ncbi:MAG TPA: hypothetical protein VKC33_05080 [Burkholderiales bacterium]|nr:hypothetical protein [Burkholderiales bacterium]